MWRRSAGGRSVVRCISTRMHRGVPLSTDSSRAHSSGTPPNPSARAAAAGKMAVRSSVAVKITLIRSSLSTPLRSSISRTSTRTRSVICSSVSASTVVAPRRARTAAATAGIYARRCRFGASIAPGLHRLRPAAGDRLLEGPQLLDGDGPPPAWRETAIGDGTDARPHQADDGVADGVAHAPDLAVATLVDGDAQAPRRHQAGLRRRRHAVLQLDPLPQPAQVAGRGHTTHRGQVLL